MIRLPERPLSARTVCSFPTPGTRPRSFVPSNSSNAYVFISHEPLNHAFSTVNGIFTNPIRRTSFEFKEDGGSLSADILRIDARFISLLKWLGENHINVRLSGKNTEEGYAVYRIREIAFGGDKRLSAEDGFLQFMIDRLFASDAPSAEAEDEEQEEDGDGMKLTSIQSITDFLNCAGRTLPDNIRLWARRNLAVARSNEVTPEERRHAQRALSIMLNIRWKTNWFDSIDPVRAKEILDAELYGMESVKQRIIETIIQINRTHTLPAYGILLVGPAGTGKSQVAYAVARILGLPWTTLDMSSINDPEQLTGSSRIYSNAKPGIIMEAFSMAGRRFSIISDLRIIISSAISRRQAYTRLRRPMTGT